MKKTSLISSRQNNYRGLFFYTKTKIISKTLKSSVGRAHDEPTTDLGEPLKIEVGLIPHFLMCARHGVNLDTVD